MGQEVFIPSRRLGFRVTRRLPHKVGYFSVRVTFDVVQPDDHACFWLKARKHLLDIREPSHSIITVQDIHDLRRLFTVPA